MHGTQNILVKASSLANDAESIRCVTITTVSYGFQFDHLTSNFNTHLMDNFPAETDRVCVYGFGFGCESECVCQCILLHIITCCVCNVHGKKGIGVGFLTPYLSCFHSVCMFVLLFFLFFVCVDVVVVVVRCNENSIQTNVA